MEEIIKDPALEALKLLLDSLGGVTWAAGIVAVVWILSQLAFTVVVAMYSYKAVLAMARAYRDTQTQKHLAKARKVVEDVEVQDLLIRHDGTYDLLVKTLYDFKTLLDDEKDEGMYRSEYLHKRDVMELRKRLLLTAPKKLNDESNDD